MKADKWLEVNLVGLVILGGLMFVTTKVISLTNAIGQLQASVAASAERLDRLAQALPAVTARVAQEQISRPLRTVVLMANPVRSGDHYQADVSVVDVQLGQRWLGTVALPSEQDRSPLTALAWRGYELDPNFASFTRMASYARAASAGGPLPANIDADVSFVMGDTAARDYLAAVAHLGFSAKPSAFPLKLNSWKDLSAALRSHPGDFLNSSEPPQPTRARPPMSGRTDRFGGGS